MTYQCTTASDQAPARPHNEAHHRARAPTQCNRCTSQNDQPPSGALAGRNRGDEGTIAVHARGSTNSLWWLPPEPERDRYVQHKLAARTIDDPAPAIQPMDAYPQGWSGAGSTADRLPPPTAAQGCCRHSSAIATAPRSVPTWNGARVVGRRNRATSATTWSWRPYFYQLLAEGWEQRRPGLSSTYRDTTSNPDCLTAGQFIGQGRRLLLIDASATVL